MKNEQVLESIAEGRQIGDYLHLYLGQECQTPTRVYNDEIHGPSYKLSGTIKDIDLVINQVGVHLPGSAETDLQNYDFKEIKPLLRPLSDMKEDDFKELAIKFFGEEKLLFKEHQNVWYACTRVWDEESIGSEMDYIQDACDDDPENVLMCDKRSKTITYGWIIWDESYHGFSMKEQAEIIKHILSKGFDLFGLIESGLALMRVGAIDYKTSADTNQEK